MCLVSVGRVGPMPPTPCLMSAPCFCAWATNCLTLLASKSFLIAMRRRRIRGHTDRLEVLGRVVFQIWIERGRGEALGKTRFGANSVFESAPLKRTTVAEPISSAQFFLSGAGAMGENTWGRFSSMLLKYSSPWDCFASAFFA